MTTPRTPDQTALLATSEWERHAARCRAREALAKVQPLPGVYCQSWPIPAAWGEPLYVYPTTLHGYRIERLGFKNGEQIARMRVPVHGYDALDAAAPSPHHTINKETTT